MKLFIAALALTILLASCGNLLDPELKGIEDVKLNRLALGESVVVLHMRCYNPNPFNAKLKQAEGDAWMDSTFLGHFRVDTTVHVPANSEFLVPVNLAINMKDMLQYSLSAFMNEEVTVRITGTARAGRNGFYRNFPLKYEGKQNLAKLFK
jgi:LEA14-like dessication related protein